MKKSLTLLSGLTMCISLTACSNNNSSNISSNESSPKTLVAYFSATGNTKRVADYIIDITSGDSFEIVPLNPYSSSDLDWTASGSRVNLEHNDESLRDIPLQSNSPENFSEYDVVFIGYPIWWGIAAWPINNFVKNNNFDGKTVIPFATSASSGIGDSDSLLKEMSSGGSWLDGHRFSSSTNKESVESWINSLNIKF